MKSNRMLTIDHEINLKLGEESNASKLINDLLKAHYGTGKLSKEVVEMSIGIDEQTILKAKDNITRAKSQLKELNKPKSMEERVRL